MKKIVMIILAMIPVLCMNAQESFVVKDQAKKDEAAIKTTFLATKISEKWFVSLGIGAADLMSEETRYVPFTDRINPMLAVSVGKWISPVWGFRLNVTGSKLQGFSIWTTPSDQSPTANLQHGLGSWYLGANHGFPGRLGTNNYADVYDSHEANASYVRQLYLEGARKTDKGAGYDYDLTYVGTSFDFLLNVNNVFRPYRSDRFFEVILLAGPAYTHTFREHERDIDLSEFGLGKTRASRTAVNTFGVKAGLQTKFNLSPSWNLFLEGQVYMVPEVFDRRVGDGNTMDGVANYMVGATYNIGATDFKEPELVDNALIKRLNDKINELQSRPVPEKDPCCDEIKGRLAEIERLLKERPKEVEKEKLKVVVHFLIDKHNVRPSEMYKLEEIATFMQKYPQVKVSVSGYADVKTAYPEYNLKLSDRRAREVVRILTSKFGVTQSRFVIKSLGDTVQPFSVNELNRAVIAFDID